MDNFDLLVKNNLVTVEDLYKRGNSLENLAEEGKLDLSALSKFDLASLACFRNREKVGYYRANDTYFTRDTLLEECRDFPVTVECSTQENFEFKFVKDYLREGVKPLISILLDTEKLSDIGKYRFAIDEETTTRAFSHFAEVSEEGLEE